MATQLNPQQVKQYYAEQGNATNPISATDWLAKQNTINLNQTSSGVIDLNSAPLDNSKLNNLISLTSPTLASTKQLTDEIGKVQEQQLKSYQEQAQAASTQKKGWMDKLSSTVSGIEQVQNNQKSTEDIIGEVYSKYGLDESAFKAIKKGIAEIESYGKEIADLEEKRDQDLLASDNNLASMDFIRGEKAIKERQWNSKIAAVGAKAGVVSAKVEALQGNINQAKSIADSVVNAVTYDQQAKVDSLKWAFNTYSDLFDQFSGEEQAAWNGILTTQQAELDSRKENTNNVLSLLLKYPDAEWPSDLSNITYEQAVRIASSAASAQPGYGASSGGDNRTADMRNYEYYAAQERAAGRTPKSYYEFTTGESSSTTTAEDELRSDAIDMNRSADYADYTPEEKARKLKALYPEYTYDQILRIINDPNTTLNPTPKKETSYARTIKATQPAYMSGMSSAYSSLFGK